MYRQRVAQECVISANARRLNSMATVSADLLIAVNVRFVDQHGNEVNGLPYEINVRGILNLKEATSKQAEALIQVLSHQEVSSWNRA